MDVRSDPEGAPAGPARLERPVFLVGAERSGTTLLRLLLDGHPDVAFASESEFLVDRMGDDGSFPAPDAYAEYLATNRVFQLSGLEVDPRLAYPALARSFLAQRAADRPVVGATVHRRFDLLLHLFPEARFVHLIRDARDVAASVIARGWAGNTWTASARWEDAERAWERLVALLPADRWLELRYEDLLRAPERELGRICAFLGIPFRREMLEVEGRSSYRRPDPSRAEAWRRHLSPRAVRLVEARIGGLLEARGYAPSGLPPLRVGPWTARGLRLQDRVARFGHEVRVLGWRLRLAEAAARRLRLRRLHRRILRRVHAVRNARLD